MTASTILVLDDNRDVTKTWAAKLKRVVLQPDPHLGEVGVKPMHMEELKDQLSVLEGRRLAARGGPVESRTSVFDSCTVLVVDFDLLELARERGNLSPETTGETVAYLARCYSNCGFIVGVNQFSRERTFDLTLRSTWSFADLNVSEAWLFAAALWRESDPKELGQPVFRPSYWPVVPKAAKDLAACVRKLSTDPGLAVLPQTGLAREDVDFLPIEALELLPVHPRAKRRSLYEASAREIQAGAVRRHRPKDEVDERFVARIAAAKVRAWLHDVVLAGQTPISDLGHAAARVSALLGEIPPPASMVQTMDWRVAAKSLRSGPFNASRYLLGQSFAAWWPRPVLNWRRLVEAREVFDLQLSSQSMDHVFCEDVSAFVPRSEARAFRSSVTSAYRDRYVTDPRKTRGKTRKSTEGVLYDPAPRLAV